MRSSLVVTAVDIRSRSAAAAAAGFAALNGHEQFLKKPRKNAFFGVGAAATDVAGAAKNIGPRRGAGHWMILPRRSVSRMPFSSLVSLRSASIATSSSSSITDTPATSTNSNNNMTEILAREDEFVKPLRDERQYRAIRLPNGLICLLAHDAETDIESAAVHIKAGHFQDPNHRPGLAHFHEHMLFLGTTKYPQENDFESFLSTNGGFSNAYTDMEDTNYYLSVAPLAHSHDDNNDNDKISEQTQTDTMPTTALAGALDRFAQFFISPLFREDAIERELRAVDSEYKNSISTDSWRNFQLLKSMSSHLHPFHKFGCGNYHTLTNGGDINGESAELSGGSNPSSDLIQFWKDNYYTTNMRLCVVGRASLDELQNMVESTFGQIPSPSQKEGQKTKTVSNGQNPFVNENSKYTTTLDITTTNDNNNKNNHHKRPIAAFDVNNLGKLVEIIPVAEIRLIKLYFPTPPMNDPLMKQTQPLRVLSHLLGHESPGSLYSLLNQEGLVNSLSSGVGIDTVDFSLTTLSLSLTPKGMKQKEYVLDLVWQWISLIRSAVQTSTQTNSPRMEQYNKELVQINKINFQFRENGDPTDFCSSVADLLFQYEPRHVLMGSLAMSHDSSNDGGGYDAEVTKIFFDRFVPKNTMMFIWDPDLDKKEQDQEEEVSSFIATAASTKWQEERWYRAKYREVDIPNDILSRWESPKSLDPRLKLPKLNEFIPTDFSLRCEDDIDDMKTIQQQQQQQQQQQKNTDDNFIDNKEEDDDNYRSKPPSLLINRPTMRLWHKMDRTFQVPKTFVKVHLSSPHLYSSPRSMTLNRIFQKVLNDDLNEFVYDANMAGCHYRVSCVPDGYRLSVSGYSEKLPYLLDVVTSRMLTLVCEMKRQNANESSTKNNNNNNNRNLLEDKFQKAKQNLLRQTKNYQKESPYETANYISRILLEEKVWHVNDYIAELEGELAELDPLTMVECGVVAEQCLMKRGKVEVLCAGNINEEEAKNIMSTLEHKFLALGRPMNDDESLRFRSLRLPTMDEARRIYSKLASLSSSSSNQPTDDRTKMTTEKEERNQSSIPIIIEHLTQNDSEENNNAVEVIIQLPSDSELGYEGTAILELISHLAYTSAYDQLRTKEQLGYIVSSSSRRTAGGGNALSIVIQSSSYLPYILEERCEAWLRQFRDEELETMSLDQVVMEASAVIAQLLEKNIKLSDEISSQWGEILGTVGQGPKIVHPAFDRLKRLAKVLTVVEHENDNDEKKKNYAITTATTKKTAKELKQQMLDMFDAYLSSSSKDRRIMSARVYGKHAKDVYYGNIGKSGILSTNEDVRQLKQFLSALPNAPYWI